MALKNKKIAFDSPEYKDMVDLRNRILMHPIGLEMAGPWREDDRIDHLYGCYDNDNLLGCFVLKKFDDEWIQMRQVAVCDTAQGQGVGRKMIEGSYHAACDLGYKKMFCGARTVATDFYRKCGWAVIGDIFDWEGLPHYRMEAPEDVLS